MPMIQLTPEPVEPLLDAKEVCGACGFGITTLYKLLGEGLPSVTYGLRIRRYRLSKVQAWLANREQAGSASMSTYVAPGGQAEPFVNAKEVCRQLGIGTTTLYKLLGEGLPAETWGLRTRRFQMSAVNEWLASRGR